MTKVWFLWNKQIRGYKFHFMHGSMAWELQVGIHVFQLTYRDTIWRHGKFHYWRDSFGKSKA